MNIHQAIHYGEKILQQAGIDQPGWNSERLLLLATEQSRSKLYAELNRELTETESSNFSQLLKKRSEHYPLAYLEGTQEFFGREFFVNESVLIPRPETEELIRAALQLNLRNPTVLDLGSGSGAISVTLARELPNSKVVSLELSSLAMSVLKLNGAKAIVRANFESPCFLPNTFDLITANLPYVETQDELPLETKWEPPLALFTPSLETNYRNVISQSMRLLKQGGYLLMEFGFGQAERLKALCDQHLMEIRKDQRGIPRLFILRKM